MDNKKYSNEDSFQKLIESSFSDNSDLINVSQNDQKILIINEKNSNSLLNDDKESKLLIKNKFLVSKTPTGSNKQTHAPKWDFDESKSAKSSTNKLNTSFYDEEEEEDIFTNEPLKEFINYREAEGQDTITSLTNNIYRKQLEKIKRKASLKGSSSSGENSSIEEKKNIINENNSNFSSSSSSNTPMLAIKSIFKSQESLFSKKSFKLFDSAKTLSQESSKNTLINKSTLDLNLNIKNQPSSALSSQNLSSKLKRNTSTKNDEHKSNNDVNKENALSSSKSDQVFDVIREAISNTDKANLDKELIDKVLSTVKILQLEHQKRKDKAKKVCLLAELFVFLVVLVMTIFFLKTVFYQIKIINNIKTNDFYNSNNNSFLIKNYSKFF